MKKRPVPKDTLLLQTKKEKTKQKLSERYYGKQDLLKTYDEKFPGFNLKYRNDLSRRVNGHKQDLSYRGGAGDELDDADFPRTRTKH